MNGDRYFECSLVSFVSCKEYTVGSFVDILELINLLVNFRIK